MARISRIIAVGYPITLRNVRIRFMHSEKQQEQAGNDDFIRAMLGRKGRALRRAKPYRETEISLGYPNIAGISPENIKVCFKR